jgi:hypothetical protein
VHWVYFRLLPVTVNSLGRWTLSLSVFRSYDAMTSLRRLFPQPYSRRRDPTSWPCWAPCCPHQIPKWLNDRYSPAVVIKGNPLPRTADAKAPFPSELDIITVLVLLPASLGYTAARASFPATSFLPEQAVLRSPSRRRGEAQSRPEEELKRSCHPWLRLQKSSSRFAGRW